MIQCCPELLENEDFELAFSITYTHIYLELKTIPCMSIFPVDIAISDIIFTNGAIQIT